MIAELRAGFLLGMALVFFLIIIAILAISMVVRPDRWIERTHSRSGLRSTTRVGVSPAP